MVATSSILGPLEPADAGLCRRLAGVLDPPPRMRVSEWVAQNISLRREQTERPGLFDPSFRPWLAPILDWRERWPTKRGLVMEKYAQSGITTDLLAAIIEMSRRVGPRMLYVISTQEDAKDIVVQQLEPMIASCPEAAARFGSAVAEGEREVMLSKPYDGGRLDFVGAGSPGKISSRPYAACFVDEYDQAASNFPEQFGDLWGFIENRQTTITDPVRIAWSHPTFENAGIDRLYRQLSDQHEWSWLCPACSALVLPRWSLVKMDARTDGSLDPDTAVMRCPHCHHGISDAERVRAARRPCDGGTGDFRSVMDPGVGERRELVGLAVHGLNDPNTTVVQLARRFVSKTSKAERMAFFNLTCGEAFAEVEGVVTVTDVAACLAEPPEVLPGGDEGVRIVTVGVDVQAPAHNPRLYTTLCAFTGSGMLLACSMQILGGWLALQEYLRQAHVLVRDPGGVRAISPAWCGIDAQWNTQNVLDACRTPVWSSVVNGMPVRMLPLQFQAHMKSDPPAMMVPLEKQLHPTRRELGPLERWKAHRHTWVDRTISRWPSKRIAIMCRPPEDLAAHVTANVLRPRKVTTSWESEVLEWEKIDGARDDWQLSMVYAEMAAALKCGLDGLHLVREVRSARSEEMPPAAQGMAGRGWGQRFGNPAPGNRSGAFKFRK